MTQKSRATATAPDAQTTEDGANASSNDLNEQDIVQFLENTVRWHQRLALEAAKKMALGPGD
jgi:hypothetical protein